MIRLIPILILLGACAPTPTELPADFDPTFQFFLPPE